MGCSCSGRSTDQTYFFPSLRATGSGAIGAICCEFGFPGHIVRGFGVMARAIGLVGHILEESENPMGVEIWQRIEDEATAHIRPE